MASKVGSDTVTNGIRVKAVAKYMQENSNPEADYYFFSYRITVTNEGDEKVKLLSRHWIIIDSEGNREDVRGPGVVGKTPDLGPGETFEYTSFCPLNTNWGTMEGNYQMKTEGGEIFDAHIGRFYLVSNTLLQTATSEEGE